jgi:eukaryotic-like serine/threonine-protein kinase
MIPSNSQCDPLQLRLLLDDRLPPESQNELAKHIEACADCRKKLESLAADPDWWDDAQKLLSTIINSKSPTGADDSANSHVIVQAERAERLRLDFLSPSDDVTKLGRLGPYEITKVIGRGGMGIVLKGFDPALNRNVAIKVLAPQWMHSSSARQRFAREAKAAAAVVHEHVIAIFAVDSANETPYLVMPFVDGISLQERIDRAGATGYASVNNPLELKQILRISIQIAEGLAAAHAQGLVHRDIKPANILLEGDCPDFRAAKMGLSPLPQAVPFSVERVLITDFGLARAVDDASFTRSCFIAGTPEYMAPEQANGEAVDQRTDLFSLGSVMYTLCTGQSPFRRETTMAVLRLICEGQCRPIRELNPIIPLWLEQIVGRLHAKNPAERFQSAGEVAELLKQWLNHIEQPSLNPRPRYPSRGWNGFAYVPKRIFKRTFWAAASAVLLAMIFITVSEMTGNTQLLRRIMGDHGSDISTAPSPADAQVGKSHAAKKISQAAVGQDALFADRIGGLWERVQGLKTALSSGGAAELPPDAIAGVRTQLAELQRELPEYRQSAEQERLGQIAAAIDQLNQPAPRTEYGGRIDASLMEIDSNIEQLNQDLYRNFP